MTDSHPFCLMSSHSWDMAIWKFDHENPWYRPWVVKGQGHIVGSTTSRFTSFAFDINRPCHSWEKSYLKIWPWKIQGQGHDQGQNYWLHLRPSVHSICSFFFFFCGNWIILSQDISNSISDLDNSRSWSWSKSNLMVTFETLEFDLLVCSYFRGSQPFLAEI